jgi:hypothetical protein
MLIHDQELRPVDVRAGVSDTTMYTTIESVKKYGRNQLTGDELGGDAQK